MKLGIGLTLGFGSLAASAVMTIAVRWLARRHNLLDRPNSRSSHRTPTPRLGGAGIVLTVLVITSMSSITCGASRLVSNAIVGAGAAIGILGLIDDLISVAARWKLLLQIAAAVSVLATAWPRVPFPFGPTSGTAAPHILIYIVIDAAAGLWIVWLTNLYNFMDGIDGLAGGQAVIAGAAISVAAFHVGEGAVGWISLALSAAATGFLIFNFPPASIFMGDIGSTTIGFFLGCLPLLARSSQTVFGIVGVSISPFLLDASVTLLGRICRGERLANAHRSHLYQRAIACGISPRAVTLAAYALMGLSGIAAISWVRTGAVGHVVIVLAVSLSFFAIWLHVWNMERKAPRLAAKRDPTMRYKSLAMVLARISQVIVDLGVLSAAFWLALVIHFDGNLRLQSVAAALFIWPLVVPGEYFVLYAFDVPRFSWRYVGLREAKRILAALATATAILFAAVKCCTLYGRNGQVAQGFGSLPLGVVVVDFILGFLGITGVRILRRLLTERRARRSRGGSIDQVPTILVGAGQVGLIVAKEICERPDLGIRAIGFLDDEIAKIGRSLHGIRVLGTTGQIQELCVKYDARQVLVTMSSAPPAAIRRIVAQCETAGIPTKIIPGVFEIVGGRVNLARIRSIEIADLLGREAVSLDIDAISGDIRDQTVMVTGAGGSIGSELCKQISKFDPSRIVLVERAETSLFHIHRELAASFGDRVVPCIADICDELRLESIFGKYCPKLVFHAAAHKHVPMMEWNPGEAVKNNILGTKIVADLCHSHRIKRFVMISTDKAVNPTSVMGASKRAAEIYLQMLSRRSQTQFITVRFGNVLGSAGSVVPLFQEQIARGGPLTVTHPEMTRYFMTIPEACQLVLQAAAIGEGGELFILDMGQPIKIVDLAHDLISLSGLRPGDIDIVFTGIRPGEKLFEDLSVAEEFADKTRHPKIFVGRNRPCDIDTVKARLDRLLRSMELCSPSMIKSRLQDLVTEYSPYQEKSLISGSKRRGGLSPGALSGADEDDLAIDG